MNGKLRFRWIASIAATFALATAAFAAPQSATSDNSAEKTPTSRSYSAADAKARRVNINTASKTELESLPGVGPAVADNIINARPFKSVSDLKSVSGIGDQRFQEIRPHVTVSSSTDRRSSASGAPANASSAYASGSDKPNAEAQARSYTPAGSPPAPGSSVVTTDSVHSGSDKPGARQKEETRSSTSTSSTRSNGAKVNINTASKVQLEALPGIGPVKAQAIIDGRPYTAPEDIMKVNGIKEGTYDKIRDQITTR